MDPIRRKLSFVLTEAAHKGIKALDPQSPCAKELNGIEDFDAIITEEIEKVMKKTSGQKREPIKSQLKKIAEQVVTRAESQLGPLTLPETCQHLLLEL